MATVNQGGFAIDRYGLLIFSWVCRVDNEKHNLSYVKPAFSPQPVRLRHFINFFPHIIAKQLLRYGSRQIAQSTELSAKIWPWQFTTL